MELPCNYKLLSFNAEIRKTRDKMSLYLGTETVHTQTMKLNNNVIFL